MGWEAGAGHGRGAVADVPAALLRDQEAGVPPPLTPHHHHHRHQPRMSGAFVRGQPFRGFVRCIALAVAYQAAISEWSTRRGWKGMPTWARRRRWRAAGEISYPESLVFSRAAEYRACSLDSLGGRRDRPAGRQPAPDQWRRTYRDSLHPVASNPAPVPLKPPPLPAELPSAAARDGGGPLQPHRASGRGHGFCDCGPAAAAGPGGV